MKKLKLLLAVFALLGVSTTWAQTDVTSTYITNPSFELGSSGTAAKLNYGKEDLKKELDSPIYGWTKSFTLSTSNGNWQYQNMQVYTSSDASASGFGTSVSPSDGTYYYFWRQGWTSNTCTLTTNSITALPKGKYTLSVDYKGATSGGTSNVTIKAKVGETVKASVASSNFPNKASGTPQTTYFNTADWTTLSTSFIFDEAANTSFEIIQLLNGGTKTNNISRADIYLDNVRLKYENINGTTLAALIANARRVNALLSDADLTTAITAASTAYSGINNTTAYQATIDDAITALQTAINTAYGKASAFTHRQELLSAFNPNFETSPIFDGTSLGTSGSSNATPTGGSELLSGATNVYNITGWNLMTTETSDYARTFTMPFEKTLYTRSGSKDGGQAIASPTNGSSVTTSNNSLLFVGVSWCNSAVLGVQQTLDLPAGKYKLTFDAYVATSLSNASSLCGVKYGETTNYKWPENLDTWTPYEIDFELDAQQAVTISMGYQKTAEVGAGSTPFLFIDNVKLLALTDIGFAKEAWEAAKETAEAARDNSDYNNITGDERTNLLAEIAKTEPTTIAGYEEAQEALENKTSAFTAAKTAYDKYVLETTRATELGVDAGDISALSEASELQNALNALNVLEDAAVTDGYTANANEIVGTWDTSNTGTTDDKHWSDVSKEYYYKYFESSNSTMSVYKTVTLPAGSYVLKAAGTCVKRNGDETNFYLGVQIGGEWTKEYYTGNKGYTGLGIDKTGAANYTDAADTYANENNGYGWEWRYIGFTLDSETEVQLKIAANILKTGWVAFSDINLLTTADNINYFSKMYETSKTTATSARDNAIYANAVKGSEWKALDDAIKEAVPEPATIKWYQDQKAALDEAKATLTGIDMTGYNRLAAAIAEATSISVDHSTYDVTNSTTAATALTNANGLYSSMLDGLKTAKAKKTLGFESGEYAPYNNVAILAAWVKADAIATVADATTTNLDDAITSLNGANWADANVAEVNAIAGGAELDSYTHSGSYDIPNGWTNTGFNTRVVGITESIVDDNPGLAGVTGDRALLVKYGTTYGGTTGYTLPLKENTVYKFTFKYGLWNENIEINKDLSVTSPSSVTINMIPSRVSKNEGDKNKCANKLTTAWYEYETWFKTAEAGDYVLNIANTDGDNQRQMVFAELELKKAVATDLTISETADAAPAISYSNVTLERAFNAGWNAVCLPFDADAFDSAEIYEFTSETADGDNITLNFSSATSFVANTPYLVYFPDAVAANKTINGVIVQPSEVSTSGTAFDFKGVYTVTNIDAGNWVISGGDLKKASSTIALKPTRTYFAPKGAGARIAGFTLDGEETTGLKAVMAQQGVAVDGIYNLKGQKVSGQLKKGVYVVNGKKVVK